MSKYSLIRESSDSIPVYSSGPSIDRPARKTVIAIGAVITAVTVCIVSALQIGVVDATSLYTSYPKTPRMRSSWLDDEGVMEYDHVSGWQSKWSTIWDKEKEQSGNWACDEMSTLEDGQTKCTSGLQLISSLVQNSAAQNAISTGGANDQALEKLASTAETIRHLRGKRILIAGDSICHNVVAELSHMLAPTAWFSPLDLIEGDRQFRKRDLEERGELLMHDPMVKRKNYEVFLAATLVVPIASNLDEVQSSTSISESGFQINSTQESHHFRIDFVFLPGSLTVNPEIKFHPLDPVSRIDLLLERVTNKHATTKYDFITANLGLWDLAALQRKILTEDRQDPLPGLAAEELSTYTDQLDRLVVRMKEIKPAAPVAIRLLHDVHSTFFAGPAHPADLSNVVVSPTFKPLRVVQMRNAQYAASKRHNVGYQPFAWRMQGQPADFTIDTVHPNPFGIMVYAELLFREVTDRA